MLTSAATDPELRELPTRLEAPDLIRAFRIMYLSRRMDDREILLKRQNKIYFQVSGAGHEGIQTAAGMALRPGHDWFYPYYRDRALCAWRWASPPRRCCCRPWARKPTRRRAGGRCPRTGVRHGCTSSRHRRPPARSCCRQWAARDATAIWTGDRTRSRWSPPAKAPPAKASSGRRSTGLPGTLPVLFLVEDNGYAISVPVEEQTAGGNISRLVSGLPEPARFSAATAQISSPPTRPWRKRSKYCRRERMARRWCTPPASGLIRIRCRTTKGFTRPTPSARRKRARPDRDVSRVVDRRRRAGSPRPGAVDA